MFVLRQSKTISMDRDLKELINTIDEKKPTIQSTDDLIEASTDKVISSVGQELFKEMLCSFLMYTTGFASLLINSCTT